MDFPTRLGKLHNVFLRNSPAATREPRQANLYARDNACVQLCADAITPTNGVFALRSHLTNTAAG